LRAPAADAGETNPDGSQPQGRAGTVQQEPTRKEKQTMDALLRTWAGLTAGLVTGGEPGTEDSTRLDGSNIDPARIADLSRLLLDTSTDRRHRIVSQLSPDERVALADSLTPGQLGRVLGPLTEHCTRDVWAALLHRAAHRTSHRKATIAAIIHLGDSGEQAAWAVQAGAMDADAEHMMLGGNDLTGAGEGPFPGLTGPITRLVGALRPLTGEEQQHLVQAGSYEMVLRERIDEQMVADLTTTEAHRLTRAVNWLHETSPEKAGDTLARHLEGASPLLRDVHPRDWFYLAAAAARCSNTHLQMVGDQITANAVDVAGRQRAVSSALQPRPRTWVPTVPNGGAKTWPENARTAWHTFDATLAVIAVDGLDSSRDLLGWATRMWLESGTVPSAEGLRALYAQHPQAPGLLLAAGEWWNPDADVTGLAELISTAVRQCAGEGEVELYSISHAPSAPPVRLAQALDGDAFLWAVGSGQIPAAGWLSGTIAGPDVTADTIRAVTEALYLDVDAAIAGLNTHPDLVAILADRAPVRILQPQHRTRLNREAFRQLTGWLRQHLGDNPSTWDWLDRESRLRHYDTYRLGNSVASALGVLH